MIEPTDSQQHMFDNLGSGYPPTMIATLKYMKAGTEDLMYRKIAYHAGVNPDEGKTEVSLHAMALDESVTAALAHEIDHIDGIKRAYDTLINGYEELLACMAHARRTQAKNN